MSKSTNDSDVTEVFGSVIGMAVLGLVLIGGPVLIVTVICLLSVVYFGIFGAAMIAAWLIAGIVCMCVSGIKQGVINWGGGSAAVVVGGAVLFVVIGGPIRFIGGMMKNSGSSMSKEEKFRAAYPDIQRTIDHIKKQEARGKFIGDGDGF